MNKADFTISPFGGVAEIGSNMTVFEFENELLIIDYGILFPYDDFFDINYLIVDIGDLKRTQKKITLFITHGHEDHIGAVVHLIHELPQAKIVAPRFARQLILNKLKQKKLSKPIDLYNDDFELNIDGHCIRPVHVTHSIPDTFGVMINKGSDLSILFISDFKYDEKPGCEEPFDTKKIVQHFTPATRRIAFLDSTNILKSTKTLSESDLIPSFKEILSLKKRTFLTMFASNIYRIRNILEVAKENNRKVVFIGRSLHSYLEAAQECKLLSLSDYPIVELDAVSNPKDPKYVFIVTGSQGEHLGATRRIANGDQKGIQLNEDDLFVFSSKAIPGNEKRIYRIFNQIAEYGSKIITSSDKQIHASGHPGQEDLRRLVEKIKPTDIIPIHGETYFLRKHIQFIEENFPEINPHFITNFDSLHFKGSEFKILDNQAAQPIIIHGNSLPISREKISERRKLACNGLINVTLSHKKGRVQIETLGLPTEFDELKRDLIELISYTAFQEYKNRDYEFVMEKIRVKVRKMAQGFLGYRPITMVSMA